MELALIGFGSLIVLLLLHVPIAMAMGIVGFFGFAVSNGLFIEESLITFQWKSLFYLVGRTTNSLVQSYELSVIPLFILMGDFISQGGLSKDLYRFANALVGHYRGGLSLSTILACGGFSSVCGSSLATTATMSKIAYPEMQKNGYSQELACASVVAGSTLGILIPPSVILIIYGLITEQSIRELFAAGFLPGLLGILLYLGAARYVVWRKPEAGPASQKYSFQERWHALLKVYPSILLFLVVMGGIYGGVFTPTEAAGIGATGGFLIALLKRSLNWSSLFHVLKTSSITSAKLFLLLIGASIFSRFINDTGVANELTMTIASLQVNPYVIIILMMVVYILLGMVLESLSMILLTVPLFFPVVSVLGFDLVWFGILVVVVTEISLITPPVGLNVFVMSSVLKGVTPTTIFKGVTPFWVADMIRLILLIFFPMMSLWLPSLVYR